MRMANFTFHVWVAAKDIIPIPIHVPSFIAKYKMGILPPAVAALRAIGEVRSCLRKVGFSKKVINTFGFDPSYQGFKCYEHDKNNYYAVGFDFSVIVTGPYNIISKITD